MARLVENRVEINLTRCVPQDVVANTTGNDLLGLFSIPNTLLSVFVASPWVCLITLVTADTSSYMPPRQSPEHRFPRSIASLSVPINATCPGRLSVGTRVCEMPKAPLVSMIERRYGAANSGEVGIEGKGYCAKARSARRPSARYRSQGNTSLSMPRNAPTIRTRRLASPSLLTNLRMP